MNEEALVLKLFGIPFNVGNILSGLVAALVVFAFIFWLSRDVKMKPTGKQNYLEFLIDFTNGIVKSAMPDEIGRQFRLLAFTLFMFIFVSNQLGLMIEFAIGDIHYIKSPTASPLTTLTLAFIVLTMAHFVGAKKFGLWGYVKNSFLSPMPMMAPISMIEQFTNFLTVALRLFGNIFSGEVLLTTIGHFAKSKGIWTTIPAIPLEMIWQGFSLFIGTIQAYVFVTLIMVYVSEKVEVE
ncbi:F0F1 ATP synthase subunit A [Ligilactobacillus ceti]|uniref:ATP synthase subunit a n=1 Tax=Ligilactobacillus ceti DSM 22408 TaxID=1122146 RepID=A0A0R2KI19_9LACO|nr:F0F1 ATP synthase subunit A [Ligilactobacillus ceti]KRN89010.1 atp synthase a chain [Ligilactobacillus ceti DSM 22408]